MNNIYIMSSRKHNEEKDFLKTIFSGEKELKEGKTKKLKSLKDLWKQPSSIKSSSTR